MKSKTSRSRAQAWIALALCAGVAASGALAQLVPNRPAYAKSSAPEWLPLAAAGLAALGIIVLLTGRPQLPRLQRALIWGGLLLMVWAAGGLPLDLLRVAGRVMPGLMPPEVDWVGLATRALALAALVALARLVFVRPVAPAATRRAAWYGYTALALALTYPVLKTRWALGGSFGLRWRAPMAWPARYPVYLMEIRHHDPAYYNIVWGGQGQLPNPLDIMPEYGMIQAGNYSGALSGLQLKLGPQVLELNGRLNKIASTLETVTPQIEALP